MFPHGFARVSGPGPASPGPGFRRVLGKLPFWRTDPAEFALPLPVEIPSPQPCPRDQGDGGRSRPKWRSRFVTNAATPALLPVTTSGQPSTTARPPPGWGTVTPTGSGTSFAGDSVPGWAHIATCVLSVVTNWRSPPPSAMFELTGKMPLIVIESRPIPPGPTSRRCTNVDGLLLP